MSKHIHLIAVLALSCISAAAMAQTASSPAGGKGAANFAQHKQKELDRIAAHQQVLQTLQSCVQGANDAAAIKACNQAAHASMKAH